MFRIDEVQKGIFRIANFDGVGIGFNQFLIVDEEPTLIHTGTYPMYDGIRAQIREVLDPGRLHYVVIPHFEADECGGMDRFLAEGPAPRSSAARWEPRSTWEGGMRRRPTRCGRTIRWTWGSTACGS